MAGKSRVNREIHARLCGSLGVRLPWATRLSVSVKTEDHMMGYGYGGGFMWLLFFVLIGVVIYIFLQSSKSKGSNGSFIETPLDILKKRYAKGEINKEEFDRMKKDIEAS